ncbi:MAG: mandelate racemase/muconate lactonizing enzyme family protein [Chloroflexota bacterium]
MTTNARLKITDIKVVQLRIVEEVGSIEPAWDVGGSMPITSGGGSIVEIHTDQGLVGIGPGIDPSLLEAAKACLVGEDPFDMERHVGKLRYYVRGSSYRGSASIDIALWDLIGKACGQPLYKLWGGGETGAANSKVAGYASMVRLSTPEERADLAVQVADEGWQAIKLRIHCQTMQEDIAIVEKVREAVGNRLEIMVDANQAQSRGNWQPGVQWDYRRALETAIELEQLGCYWLEEPLPRYAFDDIAKLNQAVTMPIAGGENNVGIHEFLYMLQNDVYDILQPEGMVNVGMSDLRKIGVLGEAFGKKVIPHHGGRGLGTIAHLHLVASWPHSPYLEMLHDPPVGDYRHGFSILQEPLVVGSDGCVTVPQGPGLGVEINPDLRIA